MCRLLLHAAIIVLPVAACIAGASGQQCAEWYRAAAGIGPVPRKFCQYTIFPERESSSSCNLTVIDGETKECANMTFETSAPYDRDLVRIEPYWTDLDAYFNISFVKPGWRYMKYRLSYTDGKGAPGNFCHEAKLDLDSSYGTASTSCAVFMQESSVADLFFTAGESARKTMQMGHYRMRVPKHDEVDHYEEGNPAWKPIAVLDVTTPPDYRIHWRIPPAHVKAPAFCAKIYDGDQEIWKRKMNISQCGKEYCVVPAHLDDVNVENVTAEAPIRKFDDECPEEPDPDSSALILWGILGSSACIVMITVVLLVLVCYLIASRSPGKVKVVVVHLPAFRDHHKACNEFFNYLEDVAGVQCVSYERACAQGYQDPQRWLRAELDDAKAVLVMASPPATGALEMEPYKRPAMEVLQALEEMMRDPTIKMEKDRVVPVVPYYLEDANVPVAGRGVTSYNVPLDTPLVVARLHHRSAPAIALLRLGQKMLRCWPLKFVVGPAAERASLWRLEEEEAREVAEEEKEVEGEKVEEVKVKTTPRQRTLHLKSAWKDAGIELHSILKQWREIEKGDDVSPAPMVPWYTRWRLSDPNIIFQPKAGSTDQFHLSGLDLGGSAFTHVAMPSIEEVSVPEDPTPNGQFDLRQLNLGGSGVIR